MFVVARMVLLLLLELIFDVKPEVGKLRPGGHVWSDELFNPACRASQLVLQNPQISLISPNPPLGISFLHHPTDLFIKI